jgi:hypothetical protein
MAPEFNGKKRKEPSQSRTLIDFFSNNAPIKKSKPQSSPPETDRNSENFKAPTPEIIIIDSDSDDHSPKRGKGRTAAIPTAKGQRSSAERGKGTLYCAKQCEWKPSLTHAAPSSKPEVLQDGPLTFGRPSNLLQAPIESSAANAEACKKTSSGIETTSSASIFGVPTSLLRSSVDPALDPPLAKKNQGETFTGDGCTLDQDAPTPYEHLGDMPHSIDVKSDDELWGVRDDELAAIEAVDDDFEMEDVSEQLNDAPSSHSASCPVCERDLSRLLGLVSDVTACRK